MLSISWLLLIVVGGVHLDSPVDELVVNSTRCLVVLLAEVAEVISQLHSLKVLLKTRQFQCCNSMCADFPGEDFSPCTFSSLNRPMSLIEPSDVSSLSEGAVHWTLQSWLT